MSDTSTSELGMSLNEAEGIARGVARMGVAEHDESPQARQSRVVLALMAEVDRVRKGGTPEVLDARHFSRQARWSRDTFGDGARTAAILDHIRKELLEIEADPTDLSEWVDVLILAADGAWRAGHTPQALVAAVIAKQAKNEARVWPDWRTAEPGKAIEHDRTAEPSRDSIQADEPTYFCGRCGDTGEILLPLSGGSDPCDCPAATGEPYPADTPEGKR